MKKRAVTERSRAWRAWAIMWRTPGLSLDLCAGMGLAMLIGGIAMGMFGAPPIVMLLNFIGWMIGIYTNVYGQVRE